MLDNAHLVEYVSSSSRLDDGQKDRPGKSGRRENIPHMISTSSKVFCRLSSSLLCHSTDFCTQLPHLACWSESRTLLLFHFLFLPSYWHRSTLLDLFHHHLEQQMLQHRRVWCEMESSNGRFVTLQIHRYVRAFLISKPFSCVFSRPSRYVTGEPSTVPVGVSVSGFLYCRSESRSSRGFVCDVACLRR